MTYRDSWKTHPGTTVPDWWISDDTLRAELQNIENRIRRVVDNGRPLTNADVPMLERRDQLQRLLGLDQEERA